MTSHVSPAPIDSPAIDTHKKESVACDSENVPVAAAATAKRNATRPLASLNNASPSKMAIMRRGMWTRREIASTATGSVGETMAAMANATGKGTSGIIQWIRYPTPITVRNTKPNANCRMDEDSRSTASLDTRQPSKNNKGGRNNKKKMSGSINTPR
ncbi:hypothetical protein D3C72_1528890 [compost metagenome]